MINGCAADVSNKQCGSVYMHDDGTLPNCDQKAGLYNLSMVMIER
jgi:hypothetical protein